MRSAIPFVALLLGGMLIAGCGNEKPLPRIVAASSVARILADAGLDKDVTVVRGASKTLEKQVLEGLACDLVVFLTPLDPAKLLTAKKITSGSLKELGNFGLAVASSGATPLRISLLELRSHEGRIAIANPETAPFGMAAKEALMKSGLWDELRARLVMTDDVALAEKLVDEGEVAFAFVPAPPSSTPKHFEVPADLHRALRVWGALTPEASPEATEFWQRLTTRAAGDALSTKGLRLPTQRDSWTSR